jgi:hypothetical protein
LFGVENSNNKKSGFNGDLPTTYLEKKGLIEVYTVSDFMELKFNKGTWGIPDIHNYNYKVRVSLDLVP